MMPRKYKPTTRLVHGPSYSSKWDFSHHVTPPLSSSTTYRLGSVKRGSRGFSEFGGYVGDHDETPVYIYDRLDEPTRSILESELADVEGRRGLRHLRVRHGRDLGGARMHARAR